jgi:hypothetical protein
MYVVISPSVVGIHADEIRSFFGQTRAFHRVLARFNQISATHRYVVM